MRNARDMGMYSTSVYKPLLDELPTQLPGKLLFPKRRLIMYLENFTGRNFHGG